ncbi:bifunctional serine/threonine-protein kinase/ABC transporter substrate-binding protein [Streptomyces albipurpureus]|uniref:Bifunctional serine/threonine-protein kinase/ABC transporter substrate-binding protein n=1 Tax=Streptomyces albipurpureus TaxID=2897419 RepID=A0ABT0V0R3_9ACTN|nr:bifunctional serine/threonine-protein kinase/ABC transporter substrate-binding protein [Streptomyces sp. CWNU-1]MCM2394321.1 bifunctional serine/threonine-protein kinase/ABC transporter substrate-binding protein [Streptomyces sp. CWNU-1]
MRPLTSEDPRTVGPYRTLVRLGAGGMGVVYLARSAGGALAAVKVIRAEHAADPGFRARFRREAEAAARVTGPWLVPVLGTDTEAREPWLATEFVPGPSLGEVVGTGGALPTATVRALGRRLAQALVAVHHTGLVHRDVKPGNVLLALDGPRLIDFGIARHENATTLTATGAVIGTPGFLAPEHASDGTPGPPSDVFSLGCVLAYAATGRGPFGGGGGAGALFRTIHEEADLTGIPPSLVPLITACLAKAPADRPTASEVRETLTAGDEEGPGDPREYPGRPGAPDPRESPRTAPAPWRMPAGLPALIADRSAAALALPDPGPPPAAPAPAAGPSHRSRRGLLTAGAALLAGGPTTAWLALREHDTTAGGPPTGSLRTPAHTIGLHADLSGPGRATGLAHQRGMQLAVADHNAHENKAFRLALRTEDDAGNPATALRAADRLAADPTVVAVVGPTGHVLREELVAQYGAARLALVVVAAGTSTVETGTGLHHCVTRPLDRALVPGMISYLTRTRPAERVLLVEDTADAGLGGHLGRAFRNAVPAQTTLMGQRLARGGGDFAVAARKAVTGRVDAVVFAGGTASRAALLATALAVEAFTGTRVGSGPALGPAFLREAGEAAEGWVFAEAYADPTALTSARAFTAAHRRRFGVPPATWAAEAYDAVSLITRATSSTSASGEARKGIAQRLVRTEHRGIVRTLAFHSTTRAVRYENGIFLYRVENSRPRFLGPYGEV